MLALTGKARLVPCARSRTNPEGNNPPPRTEQKPSPAQARGLSCRCCSSAPSPPPRGRLAERVSANQSADSGCRVSDVARGQAVFGGDLAGVQGCRAYLDVEGEERKGRTRPGRPTTASRPTDTSCPRPPETSNCSVAASSPGGGVDKLERLDDLVPALRPHSGNCPAAGAPHTSGRSFEARRPPPRRAAPSIRHRPALARPPGRGSSAR